jgi:protein-tyrosine phosphatase
MPPAIGRCSAISPRGTLRSPLTARAGKDCTGIGAALLLAALGVPRETVLADYALSGDVVRAEMQESAAANPAYAALAELPWETVEPLVASAPAHVESALSALEEK